MSARLLIVWCLLAAFIISTLANAPSKCPMLKCKACDFGYVVDEKGCSTCECLKNDPCATVRCASGTRCEKGQCVPVNTCAPMLCTVWCPAGYKLGSSGCQTCECNYDPCQDKKCATDETCVTKQVQCLVPPCDFIAQCVNNSAPCDPVCERNCPYRNRVDQRGCPICSCNPDPCLTVKCFAAEHCEARDDVLCKKAPCPMRGECVPDAQPSGCPRLKCKACNFGHVIDEKGCKTCQCLDPCAAVKCSGGRHCLGGLCVTVVKQGTCPYTDPSVIRCASPTDADRLDACGTDGGCEGALKCCRPSCPGYGLRCTQPDP